MRGSRRSRRRFFDKSGFRFRVGHRVRCGRFRDLRGGCLGDLFRRGGLRFGFQIGHIESVKPSQLDGHVLVDGAGVGFLFGNAQFRQAIQDFMSLDFQFPRQLVDSNLLHRE